jgi:prolyl oligopeptidase
MLRIGQVWRPEVRRSRSGRYRYFHLRRKNYQDQPVLLVRDELHGPDRVLVDPNQLDRHGTHSLDWYYPSHDGARVAYGLSRSGSEDSTLFVVEAATARKLPTAITRTRHCSVCWKPDNSGFFYSRFPAPGSVPEGEERYHRKIHEHVFERDPAADPAVFGAGRELTEYPSCAISPNGRWLVVRTHHGWSRSEIFLADRSAARLVFRKITQGRPHRYDPLVLDDVLYVSTNEAAPRNALFSVDPARPERADWRLVLSEHKRDVLDGFTVVGDQILVSYLRGARSRLERFDRAGRSLGPVELPRLGSSGGFSGAHDGAEAFFDFESLAQPRMIHRIDLTTGRVSDWASVESPFPPDSFTVEPRQTRSRDQTLVPYLVVRAQAARRTSGPSPTLLHGYGGFNLSLRPRFSPSVPVWLERGGVYVLANLRGGGEFGEQWHRAGKLGNKQNVFDDFIAVAEHLIARGVTTRDQLAIYGRSNGGLLVAAAITQRPDLFRAAAAAVPLTDMLRYDRFGPAKLWVPEYGSPDVPEQFRWLLAYSPYHRVTPGTAYPAVLLMTAASDTRVDPLHARKMTAALQAATVSQHPILLRTELQAGHGSGKPAARIVREYADLFSFLLWQLGVVHRDPDHAEPGGAPPTVLAADQDWD